MVSSLRRGDWSGLVLLAGGFLLVLLSWGGYALGHFLDQRIGTGTRWSIVGLIVGAGLGFWDLYRIARWVIAQQPSIAVTEKKLSNDFVEEEGIRDQNHES